MAVNPNKLIPAKIKLKSSDDEIFEVDYAVAAELGLLGFMLEVCNGLEFPIPLPFISSKVLSKLDQQFVKVDYDTLFDLLMATYSRRNQA